MRTFSTIGLLVGGSIALAQTPGQPAVNLTPIGQQPPAAPVMLNPQANRLHALLLQWEQKMKTVTALKADVTRTETDAISKSTKVWKGQAKFLRPDRASLRVDLTASNPPQYEHYIYTGAYLYEYAPLTKKLRIHELAPQPGQMVDDNFLNFVFAMKAQEALNRYDLTLLKEDENYVYISDVPKFPADRQDFTQARLALWAKNFLPREVRFESPNKDTVQWDIWPIDPAAKLTSADFAPPQPPKDWQVQRVPRATAAAPPAGAAPIIPPPQPTKVRPSGG